MLGHDFLCHALLYVEVKICFHNLGYNDICIKNAECYADSKSINLPRVTVY
jgi:hypothetical protein